MTKSRYPYAPDEFDAPAPQGAPVGVHRTPRSGWSRTWPFLLVAVIFAGIAYGGVAVLGNNGSPDAPPQAQSSEPSAETPAPDATETPTDDESKPAKDDATDEPSDEPTDTESDDPADVDALIAVADPGASVRVMNDGGPGGSAATGKDALDAKGFTNVSAENYPGSSGVTGNVVWYTGDRADTAAAVAAVLGIPAEQVSEQKLKSGDVMVVITSEIATQD